MLSVLSFRLCLKRGGDACAPVCVPHVGDAQGSSLSAQPVQLALLVSSVCVCLEYVLSITAVGLAKEKEERSKCIHCPGMEISGCLCWTPGASGKSVLYK